MSTAGFVAVAALNFAATLVPSGLIVVARTRLGVLRAASWLVIWGVVIAMGEHAMWAMRLAFSERYWLNPHSDVHYFMAGAYAAIGGVLLVVVAGTLLREGRPAGWWALLFVLLMGGTLELVMNGPTGILFQHGLNRVESIPQGAALFGYPFAWTAALAISWGPILRPAQKSVDFDPGVVTAGHSGVCADGGLAGARQAGPTDPRRNAKET